MNDHLYRFPNCEPITFDVFIDQDQFGTKHSPFLYLDGKVYRMANIREDCRATDTANRWFEQFRDNYPKKGKVTMVSSFPDAVNAASFVASLELGTFSPVGILHATRLENRLYLSHRTALWLANRLARSYISGVRAQPATTLCRRVSSLLIQRHE